MKILFAWFTATSWLGRIQSADAERIWQRPRRWQLEVSCPQPARVECRWHSTASFRTEWCRQGKYECIPSIPLPDFQDLTLLPPETAATAVVPFCRKGEAWPWCAVDCGY